MSFAAKVDKLDWIDFTPYSYHVVISGGSRHSAKGRHHVAFPDIRPEGKFDMFPSRDLTFISSLEGQSLQPNWMGHG